jgi:hypothetical protein
MKDAEDEAFDELVKRQGHWGGGYQAKRQMAADKLQDGKCKYGCPACDARVQPAQEPVAWWNDMSGVIDLNVSGRGKPLYTAPSQRPWVGLTDEELKKIWYDIKHLIGWYSFQESARATEAKLKERNS